MERKVIDHVSSELQKALNSNRPPITAIIRDGKGLCPGCSREVKISQPDAGAKFMSVKVQCPECKTDFVAQMQDDGDDDQDGLMNIPEKAMLKFFIENPNPTDETFHEHSEKMGWVNPEAETLAYRFASRYAAFRTGGTSKGARPTEIITSEESLGQMVEKEHTSYMDDSLKIAWDHLAEVPNSRYYTFLALIEKTLKAGPEHPIYVKMMKLVEEAENLPNE